MLIRSSMFYQVSLVLFGGSGNYATALYKAAVKINCLDKVESEVIDFVGAMMKSPMFSQFAKDLSVRADTRTKAIEDISAQAKFSEITKNFLSMITTFLLLTLYICVISVSFILCLHLFVYISVIISNCKFLTSVICHLLCNLFSLFKDLGEGLVINNWGVSKLEQIDLYCHFTSVL